MTKMRTKVMLTVMAAMSMVAACGMNVTPTDPDTTVAAETVETVTDLAHKVNEAVAATEVMTTEETTVEETTAEETTAEETTEVETAAAEESTEETTAAPKAETKAETKAGPKAETKAETKAAPKAPAPTQAAPAPTQAPAHTHQWKEHKATRQEWVSNIVSVPDYETREELMTYIICNCGAEFRAGDSNFAMHNAMHLMNGEPDNYSSEVRVIGSEEVQVGSHEEDQGYYTTVEYVDYQYCDCGATK